MTSVLKVDNIQNSSGTTAATIDSSGSMTFTNTKLPCNVAATFRFTDSSIGTDNAVLTAWEESDDASYAGVGGDFTTSSGVFTFPETGLYILLVQANGDPANGDNAITLITQGTTDNSTYDDLAFCIATGEEQVTGFSQCMFNVTDTSTHKVRFKTNSLASGSYFYGSSAQNRTSVLFLRIADAQ